MSEPQDSLEAGLRRISRAVERADDRGDRAERRLQRRAERRARRHGKPAEEEGGPITNLMVGSVFLVAAAILAVLAITGSPWWFLFIALGLGISGAAQVGKGLDQRRAERAGLGPEELEEPKALPAPAPIADPERARVDEIAGKLTQAFEEGPEVLKEIVRKPKETIEGLRQGHHALLERERGLRAATSERETARLEGERRTLQEKIDRSTDPATRQGYTQAMAALEVQQRELGSMLTAANRLEAERTRLRLTMESLHAQVLRARAMHGGAATDELRQTLSRLSDEVGAVASALEEIHGPAVMPPIAPIEAPGPDGGQPSSRDRVR